MEKDKKDMHDKLLWIDLEMTGLDVTKERIIEVAAIVTDLDFQELDSYHAVVKQEQSFLDTMDDWNKKTHGATGLLAQIPNGKDPSLVEKELIQLVEKNFTGTRPVIAGNSIPQDRLFIDAYWKSFAQKLHYRMLDVSAWKVVFEGKYKKRFAKPEAHRAMEDIQGSIEELQYYLGKIRK